MNLAERRRALMMQQGDGNLAKIEVKNWSQGIATNGVEKINDGYRITSDSNMGGWNHYQYFFLTSLDTTEKLWGKTVKVSVDIKTKYDNAATYFRFGYQSKTSLSIQPFYQVKVNGNGTYGTTYKLPDVRPSDMVDGEALQIYINTQAAATEEPNTVEITNVRLEVVE